MIIEMLKNFAIDDNAQNIIVDIGKMRKLLPYTMNVEKHHLTNVVFAPFQKKEDLNYSLNAADVHIVTNALGVKGVSVPSKIYGILAVNKPIWGILEKGSEAWRIIEDSNCGILAEAAIFAERPDFPGEIEAYIAGKEKTGGC